MISGTITQLHFFNRHTFNCYTRHSIHKLQRWPRAVGKLAGDATLGPGQFLFLPTRKTFVLQTATGNRVPLAFWKSGSIRC